VAVPTATRKLSSGSGRTREATTSRSSDSSHQFRTARGGTDRDRHRASGSGNNLIDQNIDDLRALGQHKPCAVHVTHNGARQVTRVIGLIKHDQTGITACAIALGACTDGAGESSETHFKCPRLFLPFEENLPSQSVEKDDLG
jgi:hypothetical protein